MDHGCHHVLDYYMVNLTQLNPYGILLVEEGYA